MSGFDKSSSTDLPAPQHSNSHVRNTHVTEPALVKWGEPMPLLWGEIYHMYRRVSERRGSSLTQWLKQTFQSWKSVFRRPGYLVSDRGD